MAGVSPLRWRHCPMGQVPQELQGRLGAGSRTLETASWSLQRGVMRQVVEVVGKWHTAALEPTIVLRGNTERNPST